MHFNKYKEEELRIAVKQSFSIRQTLIKLGIIPAGGNYQTFNKAVKLLNIDISHFRGQGWNSGIKTGKKVLTKEYLSNKRPIQSNKLRKRLLDEGYFNNECSICKNSKWMNKSIPLELDHINGNHLDNSIANLRIVCPNCHAQTNTYRGRNKRKA